MRTLRAGAATAAVDPDRGGRLASLLVDGRELLVPAPDATDRSIRWGCFLMAPWVGRLEGGRFDWDGDRYQLRRTHGRHAIHGAVYDHPWTVGRAIADEVDLHCELGPAGWPLGGLARQRIRLQPDSLTLEATIEADRSMPAALGWHPWFLRNGADPRLSVQADETLETRRLIPTGRRLAVGGRTDLRAGPSLGDRRLDHSYVDARSPAVIAWPDLELRIDFAAPLDVVVVYTPRDSLCVEPQTAWPNALAAGRDGAAASGLSALGPGEALSATMTLRWS